MAVLDYTKQFWGHSMNCFGDAPEYGSWLTRLIDKRKNRRRYLALIHSSKWPERGDIVKYTSQRGVIEGKIYEVEWLRDPRDMYRIYFEVIS